MIKTTKDLTFKFDKTTLKEVIAEYQLGVTGIEGVRLFKDGSYEVTALGKTYKSDSGGNIRFSETGSKIKFNFSNDGKLTAIEMGRGVYSLTTQGDKSQIVKYEEKDATTGARRTVMQWDYKANSVFTLPNTLSSESMSMSGISSLNFYKPDVNLSDYFYLAPSGAIFFNDSASKIIPAEKVLIRVN